MLILINMLYMLYMLLYGLMIYTHSLTPLAHHFFHTFVCVCVCVRNYFFFFFSFFLFSLSIIFLLQ